MSINVLFVIGGDGTLRGARRIARVIAERGEKIAVVGVPKTIDNDIMFIDQSFGFQTAVAEATRAVRAAHAEAEASPNGIGLLKLMGRHSGFLACYAALANVFRRRLETRRHAVIVAAEGAGQHLLTGRCATDALGNVKLQEHPGLREAAAGRILCSHRHGVQSQVHRPELRNSKRARQSIR